MSQHLQTPTAVWCDTKLTTHTTDTTTTTKVEGTSRSVLGTLMDQISKNKQYNDYNNNYNSEKTP